MARAHPHKADVLRALKNGVSDKDAAEQFGVKLGTVRVWITRWQKKGALPITGAITPPITPGSGTARTPDNVLPLPQKPERRGGKTRDPEERKRKREAYHREHQESLRKSRVRALSPVDRQSVRRIIRRLVGIQETGLWCPTCEPDALNRPGRDEPEPNQLTPKELLDTTRALYMNLDKLGPLLEVEERLEEKVTEERGLDYYQGDEGQAELASSLVQLGPRTLAAVLASDPQALRVVQAALNHAQRSVG